jgi:hypothetical protein
MSASTMSKRVSGAHADRVADESSAEPRISNPLAVVPQGRRHSLPFSGPVICLAVAGTLLAAGCTQSVSGARRTDQPSQLATPPPEPDLAVSLHPNYRVSNVSQVNLTGGATADRVVVSTGPGLDPTSPVSGNTGDVQVLAYDAVAKRWNVVFDAANKLPADSPPSTVTALLPQTDRLGAVAAQPVQLAVGEPVKLLITSIDSAANHPYNIVGILGFESGASHLAFQDIFMNATIQIAGPRIGPQTLSFTSDYFTPADPACCPLRKYKKSIGRKGPDGLVGVLSDDRPWLGAWLAAPLGTDAPPGSGVITAIVGGSPASTALKVGDIVTGIAGTLPSATQTGPSTTGTVAAFDKIGSLHAGDRASFIVQRDGTSSTVPVVLGSPSDPSNRNPASPRAAVIGISVADGPPGRTPGIPIAQVALGGPASRAGLEVGQIITAADGVSVRTITVLAALLTNRADSSVSLTVLNPATSETRSVSVTPVAQNSPALDSGII